MAVILVLFCSGLGFASAIAALLVFDANILQAFILWMSTGFIALTLAVLPAVLPRRPAPEAAQAERA